jgi:hypothetical protein
MTNYDRGLLYQLAADGTLLRRVQVGALKLGVGLAILPWCWSHNGDVNSDGCIDDADLLAVLFQFGGMERGIREDTNCDGIVDDARPADRAVPLRHRMLRLPPLPLQGATSYIVYGELRG